MSKFDVKPSRFQKVQGRAGLESIQAPGPVEMIVKVTEKNYVPRGVKVRARVDATMFTCEGPSEVLERLEKDPKVKSVSVSRPLRVIE